MCLDLVDGQEWGNEHERQDGTADNSGLTSIITDNIFGTSPSLDVREAMSTSYSSSSMTTPEVLQKRAKVTCGD